jgi:uncharacterized delta-60 repeat protein
MSKKAGWSLFFVFMAACGLALVLGRAQANPGELDPTWGEAGLAATDFSGLDDRANALELAPDGTLIVSGWADVWPGDYGTVRYLADGTPDPSFGENGRVTTSFSGDPELVDSAWSVNRRADGGYLVAGETCDADYNICEIGVAALLPDGSLDTSFGEDGLAVSNPGAVTGDATIVNAATWPRRSVLQADGKLVTGGIVIRDDGDVDLLLHRFNTDGTLDDTFSDDGIMIMDFEETGSYPQDMMALPGDRILVLGGFGDVDPQNPFSYDVAAAFIAIFKSDGTLDETFGAGNGYVTWMLDSEPLLAQNALLTDGGELVVLANVGDDLDSGNCVLQRFGADGTQDMTFGSNGSVIIDDGAYNFCWDMRPTPDGKLAFTGDSILVEEVPEAAAALAQVHRSPSDRARAARLDAAAGAQEVIETLYVLVGRYNLDGTPDESFGGDGLVTLQVNPDSGTGYGLAVQPDGKLIVTVEPLILGESQDFGVLRFLGDGPAAQVFAPVVRAP